MFISPLLSNLFAKKQKGVLFDASNKATLFQDPDRTIPVTQPDDPVGCMMDLSGNGLHATQSNTDKKPLYKENSLGRGYLQFDGVDDWLVTRSMNFTHTNQVTLFLDAVLDTVTGGGLEFIVNHNSTGFPSISLFIDKGAAQSVTFQVGTQSPFLTRTQSGLTAPNDSVWCGVFDGSVSNIKLRHRGGHEITTTGAAQAAKFISTPLYIGSQTLGGLRWFTGKLFTLALVDDVVSNNRIKEIEEELSRWAIPQYRYLTSIQDKHMDKNVAGQKWTVVAFNSNGVVTGNAANITAQLSKNDAAFANTNDVNPTEIGNGLYNFDLTQAETNADKIKISVISATANVSVVGLPTVTYPGEPYTEGVLTKAEYENLFIINQ